MSFKPYQNKNLVAVPTYDYAWDVENYSQTASSAEVIRDGSNELIDSQEPSTTEIDTFGLEFAAVQWLNLVTNAEKLFNQLLHSIVLTSDEKEQIQRWLCLKQECEECVASDEATSLGEHQRHSLERIEELTEDTEQTEDLSDGIGKSSDSQYESDTESDFDSHHPDFADKLDGYMERFRDKTDQLIRSKMMRDETNDDTDESLNRSMVLSMPSSVTSNVHQQGRRKSLHPGSIQAPLNLTEARAQDTEVDESVHSGNSEVKRNDFSFFAHGCSSSSIEPYKELKILSSENEAKKNQIKQSVVDIEGMNKRMEEIHHTIQIKEMFIKELIKNSDARASAKLKFRKKYIKLEEEYYKTRSHIAHAEYALHEVKRQGLVDDNREAIMQQKSEIDKYKNLAKHYEKRLKDIGMMRLIAGDSAKKVLELESSLLESKKELEKIKEQLQEEEEHKKKLEQELLEDQEKVKALEEKYDLTYAKELDEDGGEGKPKWIEDEGERSNRKVGQEKQKQLGDKRESLVKDDRKVHEDIDPKESLREEIRNLRKTKDCLLEQRRSLDEKYRKNKTLSSVEKRTILECDEGIEAIDATIEYKNEIMCGRKSLECRDPQHGEEGEQMLMDRLLKLSPDEMRTLLCKYFQKVIDLKESGKKMEQQIFELEHENGNQAWRIQELTQSLQTQRIETEREKVAMQRNHQEKLHLMLRHFAEESGSSGSEAKRNMVVANDSEVSKIKRENKHLRRRLQEVEALMQAAAATRTVMRIRSRSTSPDPLPLKQLPAPPSTSASTSKVTREKNKVIIRLNAPKKKSSNKDLISFCQHK